jgi:hypothetical protein
VKYCEKKAGYLPTTILIAGGGSDLRCRILVTLLHEMIRRDVKKGLASLCIGGGMGVALAIER